MLVNIITICYNSESTIERTILSVLNQSYDNIRYIIIDGGSTDQTLQIINKYKSKISVLISESDKGIYFAMNKGLSHVQEGLVGILNSDDIYASTQTIQQVVDKINQTKSDALYGNLLFVKKDKTVRYWKAGILKLNRFKLGWMPPHPTFFVQSCIYARLGDFNTRFKLSADYELILRFLYKNKITCAYLDQTLIHMELGGASNKSIKNRLRANREDRLAWISNRLTPKFYTQYLKPFLKIKQFI